MKSMQRMTVIGLAGLILLSTTGCEGFITVKESEPTSLPTSFSRPTIEPYSPPAASPSPATTQSSAEKVKVQKTLNSFYDVVEDETTYGLIKIADAQMRDRPLAEIIKVINSMPGMEYFVPGETYQDASQNSKFLLANVDYADNLRGRYRQDGTSLSKVSISVPVEAITIDNDRATVNPTFIVIRKDGREEYHDGFGKLPITLKKQADGEWKILPNPNTSVSQW